MEPVLAGSEQYPKELIVIEKRKIFDLSEKNHLSFFFKDRKQ